MERADLDNANPTILNVSQLPSRRQKQSAARSGPESKFDDVLFPKSSPSWSSDEDDGVDMPEEPIDELEIYGWSSQALGKMFSDCLVAGDQAVERSLFRILPIYIPP